MRTRKLLDRHRCIAALGVFAVAGSASAADRPIRASRRARRRRSASRRSEGGGTIDDCQKAPSPILPANNELIWGAISFVVLLFLMWKFAYPGLKKGMEARTERIRNDLEEAENAKAEAETDARRSTRPSSPTRRTSRPASSKRRASRPTRSSVSVRQRCRPSWPTMRERAAADIEASKAQAIADLRAEVAALAIGAAEVVVQHNLDREHPDPAHRELHQPGRGERDERRRTASTATPTALFEVARAEGTLDEVEDELFRFARTLEGNDELRNALTDEHDPGRPAPGDRRGPARRQGHADHHVSWSSMVVGSGRGRDLPAIIDQLVARAAAEKQRAVAEVRSAVAAHRRPADPPRRGARPTPPASRSS